MKRLFAVVLAVLSPGVAAWAETESGTKEMQKTQEGMTMPMQQKTSEPQRRRNRNSIILCVHGMDRVRN